MPPDTAWKASNRNRHAENKDALRNAGLASDLSRANTKRAAEILQDSQLNVGGSLQSCPAEEIHGAARSRHWRDINQHERDGDMRDRRFPPNLGETAATSGTTFALIEVRLHGGKVAVGRNQKNAH